MEYGVELGAGELGKLLKRSSMTNESVTALEGAGRTCASWCGAARGLRGVAVPNISLSVAESLSELSFDLFRAISAAWALNNISNGVLEGGETDTLSESSWKRRALAIFDGTDFEKNLGIGRADGAGD